MLLVLRLCLRLVLRVRKVAIEGLLGGGGGITLLLRRLRVRETCAHRNVSLQQTHTRVSGK